MSYPKLTPIIAKGATKPRYLEDRFADVISVKDFGAVADGSTDDTDAVDSAWAVAAENGSALFFPAGVYRITSTISQKPALFVGGGDATLLFDSAVAGENGITFLPADRAYAIGGLCGLTLQANCIGATGVEMPKDATQSYDYAATYYFKDVTCRGTTRIDGATGLAWNEGFLKWFRLADCYGLYVDNVDIEGMFDIRYDPSGQAEDIGIELDVANVIMGGAHMSNLTIGPIHTALNVGSNAFYSLTAFDFVATYRGIWQPSGLNEPKIFFGNINSQETGIYLKDTNTRDITSVTIRRHKNGWKGATHDWHGIKIDSCYDFTISKCTMQPDESDGAFTGTQYGVSAVDCALFKASENFIGVPLDRGFLLDNCTGFTISDTITSQNESGAVLFSLKSNTRQGVISGYQTGSSFSGTVLSKDNTIVSPISVINSLAGFDLQGTSSKPPLMDLTCTSGGEDSKKWRITTGTTGQNRQVISDGGSSTNYEIITRSGTTVSSIEWRASTLLLNGSTVKSKKFIPIATDSYSLGDGDNLWTQLYASHDTINTSDVREKTCIENPAENDALMRAWSKVQFAVFRFVKAYEQEGDESRIHVGVVAQQVVDAFSSEGLDAYRYGLLCYDEWEDKYEDFVVVDKEAVRLDDGIEIEPEQTHVERRLVKKAGNRFGIRYNEALALECAYQRWRLEQLEERVNQLTNSNK